jgi:predicted DNA-binding antitoxin AbrB/MazE fold protein
MEFAREVHWRFGRQICPCRKSVSGDNGIMTTTVEAIYEQGKLLLSSPLSLPEKSHVRVTIESDAEREAWLKLSGDNLLKTWSHPDDDVFNELLAP